MWVNVQPVSKPGLTGLICRSLGGFTFQPSIGSTDAQNGNTANMAILQSKSKWSCSSSTVCLYEWLSLHNHFHTSGIISMIFCYSKCYIHSTHIFTYIQRDGKNISYRQIHFLAWYTLSCTVFYLRWTYWFQHQLLRQREESLLMTYSDLMNNTKN